VVEHQSRGAVYKNSGDGHLVLSVVTHEDAAIPLVVEDDDALGTSLLGVPYLEREGALLLHIIRLTNPKPSLHKHNGTSQVAAPAPRPSQRITSAIPAPAPILAASGRRLNVGGCNAPSVLAAPPSASHVEVSKNGLLENWGRQANTWVRFQSCGLRSSRQLKWRGQIAGRVQRTRAEGTIVWKFTGPSTVEHVEVVAGRHLADR
jgi:hypothetical protein